MTRISSMLLTAFVAASLLISLAPWTPLAADEISVTSSAATPQFPMALTFDLQASSGSPIVDVRLDFSVRRDSFARVVTEELADFNPGTSVSASYVWDMRQSGGLPTGTVVDYWWVVRDSAGRSLTTSGQSIAFEDTRFTWRSIDGNNVSIHWYNGTPSFAGTLMSAAQDGLAALYASTGARLSRGVDIYIYADSSDMQGGMLFAQEWTGGATYTPYSTIVIGISPSTLEWGKGALVHELAHMVNYQMTSNPYSGLPNWLDEGLAMYAEGPLDATFELSLIRAMARDELFSVRSMASPFSTDASLSYLEYAESYSVVDYLLSIYGEDKMAELLETFHRGSTYDGALLGVYGFDMDGLYLKWLPFAVEKYLGVTAAGVAA